MIQLKGNLELKSVSSRILLYRENKEIICAINGWPAPFSPVYLSRFTLPDYIEHERIRILYNGRKLGWIQNGRFKLTGYLAGLRAFIDFLISNF